MGYIRDHWQGKHALLFALAVNLILIRVLIMFADRYTLPPYIPDRIPALISTVAFILVFHGVVFVWQVVGVLRATQHQSSILANIWTVVSYGVIGLCLAFTALSIAASFRALAPEKFIPVNLTELEDARASQYELTLSPDNTRIHITGIFALGMTQRLAALLDQNPGVTGIVLHSDGGHVYEGRGVGFLIRNRGLDTYVFEACSSACTTAFIGGAKRYLGPNGRLGFHQYKVDLNYPVPLYDIKGQQEKEITFYRNQGIAESFLKQVFLAPHTGIWFPEVEELMEAGVVDGEVEE
ncbi:hypothetical protein HED22_16900 [Thalassospira sp. HF15]|uniref:COG3904 family protein n=1 Tax=Thalassospira sp. HF15 TaxID=2722755 RepID=UPI00142F854C|nr:hypothetical protein [Thalassospira sp. HF15]NIY77334.1 hypothetical protein [Thalassospira sp. HF15]